MYRTPEVSTSTIHGEGTLPEHSPGIAEDLAELKRSSPEFSLTAEQATAQSLFEKFATEVAGKHPEIYSTAGFLQNQEADAWMSFITDPPETILAGIRSLPLVVEVRTGVPATAIELERASGVAIDAVADSGWSVGSIGSTVEPDGSAITVEYELREPQVPSEQDRTLQSLVNTAVAAAFTDGVAPVPVTLAPYTDPVATPEVDLFGGGQLRRGSDNGAECTSGFTGSRSGGVGVPTARHCADGLRFGMNPGSIRFVGVASQTPAGNYIDLQWHKAIYSTTASPKFRSTGHDMYRDLLDTANPVVDSAVCHWGQTSGYSCTYVDSTYACYKPYSLTYCGLAVGDDHISAGGDSGGPWFLGSDGRGLHAGSKVVDGTTRSVFTMITALKYLNVTALTK